jgi:deazaflavin-dependent oxidoreductase (nitroreductase family)
MALPTLAYRLIGRFSTTRFAQVVHPILYRLTGGAWILGRSLGARTILLTTTGRRSAKARTVPIYGYPLERPGEPLAWAVIGTRGGSRKIPAWFLNITAEPRVIVQVDRQVVPSRAREAAGEEYEAIFAQAAAIYPGYHLYRRETPLHFPIVVLEPEARRAAPAGAGDAAGAVDAAHSVDATGAVDAANATGARSPGDHDSDERT